MSQEKERVEAIAVSAGATGCIAEKPTNIRWWLAGLLGLACMIAYFDRVNLAVTGPSVMQHFGLTKVQYGMTWSIFVLGYTLFQVPGGLMSEKWGIRLTGLVALCFWSVFTIATPLAWGFGSLLIIRFAFGAGEAPLFPNNGSFLQKWFNKHEKALPSGMMLTGGFIAPAIAAPCSVWIMTNWGWQAVFYTYGAAGVIIGTIWYICMREHPHEHPMVNRAEVEVIGQENVEVVKQSWAVWKQFLKSIQFWSHGFQYFIVCYIWWIYLSWLPIYLLQARGMDLKAMALANAFPFIAISIGMLVGGKLSDTLFKRGYSKAIARSSLTIGGLLICGACLYLGSMASTPYMAVVWMSLALLALGFNFTASWTICQDLGQKQTIAVVGWMQIWANLSGVFAPTVMAWLVTNFSWQTALNITAAAVVVGAFFAYLIKPDRPLHE